MKHSMKYQFVVLLFIFIATVFFVGNANAQEVTPESTPTPTIIQYDLAFPGILPDNFLYKLKVFRDKMQLIMISNPKERINFLLRLADKGMLASAMLVDKQAWKLAKETALKAEHNMTLLTPEMYNLEEPIDQELIEKLQTASLKHQEVLVTLRERVPADDQIVFSQIIDFSKRNQAEIEKYIEQ